MVALFNPSRKKGGGLPTQNPRHLPPLGGFKPGGFFFPFWFIPFKKRPKQFTLGTPPLGKFFLIFPGAKRMPKGVDARTGPKIPGRKAKVGF